MVWESVPVASLAGFRNGYAFKPSDQGDAGRPIVRIEQFLNPEAEVARHSGEGVPRQNHIATGDLIMSWSGTLAVGFWNREPALLNQHLFRVDPRPGVEVGWLRWALTEALTRMTPWMHGSAMTHITRRVLEEVRVPVPPLETQRRIADYLDTETARIDTLITKNEQAATLVEERRSGSVTSLLLTDWPRRPLRYCLERYIGGVWGSEPGEDEVDVTVLRAADFDRTNHKLSTIRAPKRSISRAQRGSRLMRAGDLVLEKSGGGDTQPVGCVAAHLESDGECVPSNFNALLRPRSDVDSSYLNFALAGVYRSGHTRPYINQTTGIQNIDVEAYMGHPIPLPDLATQRRVALRVAAEWSAVDAAFEALSVQRKLLVERRQALITSAVTGQLEV